MGGGSAGLVGLVGPVAVITGAGSGLGRAIALALLEDGFRTALLGRRRAALEETAGAAAGGGVAGGTLVLPTDVTDEQQVAEAFAAVVATWGRVDVLVNNAGTFGPSGEPDEVDPATWREVVEVNLTGSFLCAREAFAQMKRQDPPGGRILNNGSLSAQVPRPGSVAYAASKHAITGLTRSLALDGRPHRITAGQVDIGNAATEMTAGFAQGVRQANGSVRPEATFDPRHVAEAVVRLARLPLDVSVPALTMLATEMPWAGRG